MMMDLRFDHSEVVLMKRTPSMPLQITLVAQLPMAIATCPPSRPSPFLRRLDNVSPLRMKRSSRWARKTVTSGPTTSLPAALARDSDSPNKNIGTRSGLLFRRTSQYALLIGEWCISVSSVMPPGSAAIWLDDHRHLTALVLWLLFIYFLSSFCYVDD